MPDLGFGLAPFGLAPFGYGEPARVDSTAIKLYLDDKGRRRNAAEINTVTGDYIRDPQTGIHRGMDSVAQQVYLALRTLQGSAIIQSLGIRMVVKVISDTTQQKIKDAVHEALSSLVSRNLVKVDSVTVERIKITGIRVIVQWTNLTNGETDSSRWASNG